MEISRVLYVYLMVVSNRFYEFVLTNKNFCKILALCWLKEVIMYTNFKYKVSVIHKARLFPMFSRLLFPFHESSIFYISRTSHIECT